MNPTINHADREHALLSASSAARWLACPPSAIAAEAYPDQDTEFTREGTLAHEAAEWWASGGEGPGRDEWDMDMLAAAQGYRDYIEEHITAGDAVKLLEQRVDFSPWVPDGFGTCDCIIIQDNTLTVIDYKYGKGVAVDAKDNPQMMLYALGALNDYGFAYDIERVEMHIYQPRINNISTDVKTITDLMLWSEAIKPIAEKAAKGQGEYSAGAHCKFCPHAGRCRALTATCSTYVDTHGMSVEVPVLAPHEVAEILERAPLIEMWLKRVKDQALTSMLNGEQVPGYKVVEGKLGNRKWTNELEVLAALEGAGYTKDDVTETKLLSPAVMDKAIGKKKVAELLSSLIDRAPGAPTVAPDTDKRPVYDRLAEAQKDFE